jgi:hypothetical protein
MSIQKFSTKENIDTIWDVIIDEDIFKFLTREIQSNIFKVFTENIKGFFEVEIKKEKELIDMNKKYIILILTYIKKNYPNNIPSKIKIYDESETKEPITYEEIKNEKKTQIEIDFIKRNQEFTNSMSLEVPEVPEFMDKFTDKPISEMDKMIKEMTAKRNYDIEEINNSYQQGNYQWLKPEETSIKSEKFMFSPQKLDQNKIVEQQVRKKDQKDKNVSWGENEILFLKDEEEENIFKKLKKVKSFENINFAINEKTFDERLKSIEEKIEIYNDKIDKVIYLLQK